ncbi:MAG TPA: hypothetical protein PKD53_16730 [Chloroflexaceae bacterium]|nr:hypothetical protein [Chloroflexaceae bacterium]
MHTETEDPAAAPPALPPVPADLPGWAWEVSPAGDARLANAAEGYATSWGPIGPGAEVDGRIAEARKRVALDLVIAEGERVDRIVELAQAQAAEGALVVAAEPGGLPQLSTTMQRHVDRALAADRKGGEALWEKATAVADARVDAQRYGEWGLFLEATGLQERAAQRLVAIATRGRADGRFRDAVISGWLSFSVAHLTAQADDALIEQLLAAPVAPSKRQAEQLLAPNNPSPGTGSVPAAPIGHAPRPHPPCARCGATSAVLIGKHCEGCYSLLEAQKWEDGSEEARWRLAAAHQQAARDPDADRRTRRLAEIAGIARGMGFASLDEQPAPVGLGDAPLTDAELTDLSRLGGWEAEPGGRPGKVRMRQDREGDRLYTEDRSPEGWRYELAQLQAAEPARAARPGADPPPALPAGWSWRERGDGQAQAWDGTLANMTACYRPAEAAGAAADAWRRAGAPLDANPAPADAFEALAARAQAASLLLAWDGDQRRFAVCEGGRGVDAKYSYYPAGSESPAAGRAAWEAAAARVEALLARPAPAAPAAAEQPSRYPAAERALADDLRAAPPRLRRLLCLAWGLATDGDEPLGDDELFDELTTALLAATDEALGWALGEAGDAPTPSPFDVDLATAAGLEATLVAAQSRAQSSGSVPSPGDLARWQDALDALVDDLDDATYERLAHRLGALRRAGEGVAG